MSNKMDQVAARTATDIERKYNFGKSFAEIAGIATDARTAAEEAEGIATDARTAAEEAKESVKNLNENLNHEEIFNRLTNNGEIQGLFEENGQFYFNAAYIRSLEKMFAKDIEMTGTFTSVTDAFLEPGLQEMETIRQHALGNITIPAELIPSYDFNNDGKVDAIDLLACRKAYTGVSSLATWSGAKKTKVTMTIDLSNPDKAITFAGKNMWGRDISEYIGVNFTSIKSKAEADYIIERGTNGIWTYEKWLSGKAVCWVRRDAEEVAFPHSSGSLYYNALTLYFPFGLFAGSPSFADIKSVSGGGLITHSINALTSDSVSWYVINTTNTTQDLELMVYAVGKWQ